MSQKREARNSDKPRQTVRRSAEYKARMSNSSAILAEKMEEKRSEWALR